MRFEIIRHPGNNGDFLGPKVTAVWKVQESESCIVLHVETEDKYPMVHSSCAAGVSLVRGMSIESMDKGRTDVHVHDLPSGDDSAWYSISEPGRHCVVLCFYKEESTDELLWKAEGA